MVTRMIGIAPEEVVESALKEFMEKSKVLVQLKENIKIKRLQ